MTEQEVLALLQVSLGTLQTVLPIITKSNLPATIIALVENAVANLQKVAGSDITFGQLESLRTTAQWDANATPTQPKTTS